jgi:stearoyl-CoA desaturase (delta-9 desaturase)
MSSESMPVDRQPWDARWWHIAAGQTPIFIHLVAIHTLAAVGLVLYPIPGWPVFLVAIGLVAFGGLGTTVCYHRSLSHRSVKLHPAVEQILMFAAVFNGSGSPRQWVANHRRHHATSDTPSDISSPRQGGFWWAHLFWLYQVTDSDPAHWNADMDQPRYNVWTRLQIPTLVVSACSGLLMGWAGFFWIGAIRLVYSLHLQCLVNSLTHLGRNDEAGSDSSINVWWLGPFQLTAWGENWHRNHHSQPGSARFGRHWWQTDIGWYAIRGLAAVGLAETKRG